MAHDMSRTDAPKRRPGAGPMGGGRHGHGPGRVVEKPKDFKGTMRKLLGYVGKHKIAVLFAIEVIHEKRLSLTELTDRLPALARGALYLLAVMAIVIFGVWGPGYSAQAFIYFQF